MKILSLLLLLVSFISCDQVEKSEIVDIEDKNFLLQDLAKFRDVLENKLSVNHYSYQIRNFKFNPTQSIGAFTEISNFTLNSYGEVTKKSYYHFNNYMRDDIPAQTFPNLHESINANNLGRSNKGAPIMSLVEIYNYCEEIISEYSERNDYKVVLNFDSNQLMTECYFMNTHYANYGHGSGLKNGIKGLKISQETNIKQN